MDEGPSRPAARHASAAAGTPKGIMKANPPVAMRAGPGRRKG
jgi:hypothetical protein